MILGRIPVVLLPRMPTEQVVALVRERSSGHHLPSAVQTMVAILLALAEDSCGNVDNIVRESGSADLCRAVQAQMLDAGASNNAVIHATMSFSRYKQINRSSAKGKGQPLSLDGFKQLVS